MDKNVLAYIEEKAEIYAFLSPANREQFLKHLPEAVRPYKDRLISEAMKLQSKFASDVKQYGTLVANSEKEALLFLSEQPESYANRIAVEYGKQKRANETQTTPLPTSEMSSKPLNSEGIETAAREYARIGTEKREDFLKDISPLSRKKVEERGKEIITETHNAQVAKQRETNSTISNSLNKNAMSTEATTATEPRKKSAPLVLTPETNKAHKVLLGLDKLKEVAKLSSYSGFDTKNLKAKQQGKTPEETAEIFARQFQTFRRKFLLENEQTVADKPLANPDNPLHEKAIEVLRDMFKQAAEAGNGNQSEAVKHLASQAESWFNKLEEVYASTKVAKAGRPAKLTLESIPEDFFAF